MASESFLLPAAVRPPPLFLAGADVLVAEVLPPAFLRAAHRAFMDSESFLRPAAVRPPLPFPAGFAARRWWFLFVSPSAPSPRQPTLPEWQLTSVDVCRRRDDESAFLRGS